MSTALVVPERSIATVHEFDVEDVVARIVKVQQVMKQAMKEGEHYGVIPGATKPSLLKPGAELLCMVFRLDPQYGVMKTYDGDHLNVDSTCTLYHIPTSFRMGSGVGSCSTKEKKYKYRTAKRRCPACEAEAILKSKFPPKDKALGTLPGWYCFAKQGGCGAEYAVNDGVILNQPVGQILNPDLPDLWNTVTKMANKRALIAGVLNVTAASDCFTQDIEDYPEIVAPAKTAEEPWKPPAYAVAATAEVEPESGREEVSDEPAPWELVVNDYIKRFTNAQTKDEAEGWRVQWLTAKKQVPESAHPKVFAAIKRAQERLKHAAA